MKKRGMRFIAFMLAAVVCGIGITKTYKYIFSMRGCVIHVDAMLSQAHQQDIANYLASRADLYNSPLATLCDALRAEFPYIQTVAAHRCASGKLELDLTAVTPVFLINEQKVLAHNGTLYDHAIFEHAAIARLDRIAVAPGETDAAAIYRTCSKQLSSAICSRYNIAWINSREIRLQDKENEHFSCICDSATLPNDHMLALLDQIKIDLGSNSAHTRAKNWVADMRFSKQIVVHSDQGGYRG